MGQAHTLFMLLVALLGADEDKKQPPAEKPPEAAKPTPAEAPEPDAKQMPGRVDPAPELGTGLKKVGPTRWEITRDEVYQMVASMPFIAQQLWVRQVRKKGKLVGYKVKHIAKDSLPHRAGFRNGDVVTRVNGKPLASPLKLLLSILNGNQIEVQLLRKGKPLKPPSFKAKKLPELPGDYGKIVKEREVQTRIIEVLAGFKDSKVTKLLVSSLTRSKEWAERYAAAEVLGAEGASAIHWHDAKDRNLADRVRVKLLEALVSLGS